MLLGIWACTSSGDQEVQNTNREEGRPRMDMLRESIHKSKQYTLAIIEQMPDSLMGYRPIPEVMSFSQHLRHNAFYTCSQLANRLGFESPYKDYRPAVDLDREGLLIEVNRMYNYMSATLDSLDSAALEKEIEFGEEKIPAWKLFDIVENHIIHHRGACVVYLRMNGIKPKGYFGW